MVPAKFVVDRNWLQCMQKSALINVISFSPNDISYKFYQRYIKHIKPSFLTTKEHLEFELKQLETSIKQPFESKLLLDNYTSFVKYFMLCAKQEFAIGTNDNNNNCNTKHVYQQFIQMVKQINYEQVKLEQILKVINLFKNSQYLKQHFANFLPFNCDQSPNINVIPKMTHTGVVMDKVESKQEKNITSQSDAASGTDDINDSQEWIHFEQDILQKEKFYQIAGGCYANDIGIKTEYCGKICAITEQHERNFDSIVQAGAVAPLIKILRQHNGQNISNQFENHALIVKVHYSACRALGYLGMLASNTLSMYFSILLLKFVFQNERM